MIHNANQFFTKQGWLTRYAMACGYIHQTDDVTLAENNIGLNTYKVQKGYTSHIVEGLPQARKMYRTLAGKPARRFERHCEINREVYA